MAPEHCAEGNDEFSDNNSFSLITACSDQSWNALEWGYFLAKWAIRLRACLTLVLPSLTFGYHVSLSLGMGVNRASIAMPRRSNCLSSDISTMKAAAVTGLTSRVNQSHSDCSRNCRLGMIRSLMAASVLVVHLDRLSI